MSGTSEHHHAALFEHPEGTSTGDVEIDRILTVPNVITTVRLLCLPVFLYLLLGRDAYGWAGFMLGALGATDWIDGYVARRFNQSSTFGKMYDPTVDRVMLVFAIAAIFVAIDDPAFRIYAAIVVAREVIVGLYVSTITLRGAKRMNVTWYGKCATFANMCAFPWFLFANEPAFSEWWQDFWTIAAWVAAVPGVVLGLAAAVQYFRLGPRALAEGRAERAALAAAPAAERPGGSTP
ncbi:MAG TPA: CDP-alcohol phosphatidyltransferase family protein [Microthrixaceae bacterium]|nr:CDP-alcohol phosphatidyltransferase family protein [Microthrixaceae bacterium]